MTAPWEYRDPLEATLAAQVSATTLMAALDPDSDTFKFARAALVRERNRAVHALDSAASVAEGLLQP